MVPPCTRMTVPGSTSDSHTAEASTRNEHERRLIAIHFTRGGVNPLDGFFPPSELLGAVAGHIRNNLRRDLVDVKMSEGSKSTVASGRDAPRTSNPLGVSNWIDSEE